MVYKVLNMDIISTKTILTHRAVWTAFMMDGRMHFIGLQNLNSHSLLLQSLEQPGHFFM